MKRSRHTEEQIIAVLGEQEAAVPTADVCRAHGISSASKAKFGGMDVSEARRLEEPRGGERQAARRRHARQCRAEGSPRKTILTPDVKREAVAHLTTVCEMSERRACQIIQADRKMIRDRSRRPATPYSARGYAISPPSTGALATADCICSCATRGMS